MKIKISKRINKTLILLLLVVLSYAFIFSFGTTSLIAQASDVGNTSIQKYEAYENQQTYINENGDNRTIYWTKGMTAPKMPSKGDNNLGKDGYFSLESDVGYTTYSAPIKQNQGYYDLNKNPYRMGFDEEAEFCYMATAINGIYWWLDQNASYVESLKNYVMDGSIVQEEGLRNIKNPTTWNTLNKRPSLIEVDGKKRQEIGEKQTILNTFMNQFYQLHTGYFSDRVWDFFFNGYKGLPDKLGGNNYVDQNSESNFIKDKQGGIFNSIFGTKRLSKRITTHAYTEYNKLIDYIVDNQFVGISYYTNGEKTRAHSITLWGVEYDDNYNLTRVYITDSDDFDATYVSNPQDDTLRGIRSYDVGYDSYGDAYISNNGGITKSYLYLYQTLELGTDIFQQKLSQVGRPVAANIEKQPLDFNYGSLSASIEPIQVVASTLDGGTLSYQWYSSTTLDGEGTIISGAKSSSYKPKLEFGTAYYYCVIKNTKFGHDIDVKSRVSKVVVDSNFVDAKLPRIVSFNDNVVDNVMQYSNPEPMKIVAESPDGGFVTYQWYKKVGSSANYEPSGGTLIPGATNDYLIPDTTGDVYVSYYCVVTNNNLNVTGAIAQSKATSKAKRYKIIPNEKFEAAPAPTIIKHPQGATYNVNDKVVELSVIAGTSDGGKLSYQWYKASDSISNGEKILSATSNTYKPLTNSVSDYYYYCEITNTNSNATTNMTNSTKSERARVQVNKGDDGYVESNDNYLSSLSVSNQTISPNFDKNILNYTLSVDNAIKSITINATANDKKASVSGTGVKQLIEGKNVFNIVVTAEDTTTKTYVLTVTRATKPVEPSSDNYLSSISVTNHTISPNFDKNILNYTLSVDNATTSITINATTNDKKASVSGIGAKQLIEGENVFNIVVTAEDTTTKTYVLTVTRATKPVEPSSDNYLSSLSVTNHTISPNFDTFIFSYELSVANSITSITINATANDSKASVSGIGVKQLKEGENIFQIEVTAEDTLSRTYALTVTRATKPTELNNNNNLTSLGIKEQNISPNFDKNILNYTLSVDYSVKKIVIYAMQENSSATVSGIGEKELKVGVNEFVIIVTAENGDKKNYKISVTRGEAPRVVIVQGLTINGQEMKDIFKDSDIYSMKVKNDVSFLNIEVSLPEGLDAEIIIEGNENLVANKNNRVLITVIASDGTVQVCTLNVFREELVEEKAFPMDAIIGIAVFGVLVLGAIIILIVGFATAKKNK